MSHWKEEGGKRKYKIQDPNTKEIIELNESEIVQIPNKKIN